MAILIIADHGDGALRDATHKTVMAAVGIGGEIDILVAGSNVDAAAKEAAGIAGVRKVLTAKSDALGQGLAEAYQALVVSLMAGYDALLVPATAQGKNITPRIAAALGVSQISDVIEVISKDTFVHPIYAGNALETVQTSEPKAVLTVRTSAFASAAGGGAAKVESVDAGPAPSGIRFISDELVKSDRPELAGAKIVISGGRALGSAEEFRKVIEPLADRLGAAVGASRAAVDAGYAPNDYQVGQTGKVVAPDLYLAVGISGAIQHLAGMKDSKIIAAINKDPDAPIFAVADFGLVADYKTAVPELMTALDAIK